MNTYRIVVEVPDHVPGLDALFAAVADAMHAWEPDERDGWDADVSAGVTAAPASQPIAELLAALPPGSEYHPIEPEEKSAMPTPANTEQPTKVAVISDYDRVEYDADRWSLGDDGHLFVRRGDDDVAVHAPGRWLRVEKA